VLFTKKNRDTTGQAASCQGGVLKKALEELTALFPHNFKTGSLYRTYQMATPTNTVTKIQHTPLELQSLENLQQ
jgi:hypothetical protein